MKIKCVWEHNGDDSLLYSSNYVGAFTRGESLEIALGKMQDEITSYLRWKNGDCVEGAESGGGLEDFDSQDGSAQNGGSQEGCNRNCIEQERASGLDICDADSDVIFEREKEPLTPQEYFELKELALKSAKDFWRLYEAVPDKNKSNVPAKMTFLGPRPRTALEMYQHTKSVNSYYFGEIGVSVDNEGTIYECRKRGFEQLEQQEDFLNNAVITGSFEEEWSLRKVLRRFIWHDRIHGKAMYRMAVKTFGPGVVPDVFRFEY